MKSRVLKLIVLLVLLINLPGCRENNTDVLYDRIYIDEIKAARKDVSFFMARNFVPGLNVAVAREGKIIYSEGFGLASRDLEVPATRSTKFRIGGVSEVFTALLYQIMVEKGILHPDSTVRSYLPQFPEKEFRLPLWHLVQHTSGIREPNFEEEDWRGLNISIKKGIENFWNDTLLAAPGTLQIQSMFNYNLLGAVMEEATGLLYHRILKEYVTDTLGLESTVVDNPFAVIKGRSDYFDHNFVAQVVHATYRDMRYRAPSEGLLSNAEDLVNFGNALLYSDYVSENIRASLFDPVMEGNNLPARMTNGWIVLEDSGRKFYGTSGNVTGGSAAVLIYPEDKLVVACATNLSSLSEDLPVFRMAGHFLLDDEQQQQIPEQE